MAEAPVFQQSTMYIFLPAYIPRASREYIPGAPGIYFRGGDRGGSPTSAERPSIWIPPGGAVGVSPGVVAGMGPGPAASAACAPSEAIGREASATRPGAGEAQPLRLAGGSRRPRPVPRAGGRRPPAGKLVPVTHLRTDKPRHRQNRGRPLPQKVAPASQRTLTYGPLWIGSLAAPVSARASTWASWARAWCSSSSSALA